jgi:hypothetical protein
MAAGAAVEGVGLEVHTFPGTPALMRRAAAVMLAVVVLRSQAHLALRAARAVAVDPVMRAASGDRRPRLRRRERDRAE